MQIWMHECRASFASLTKDKVLREAAEAKAQEKRVASQADDLIDFVQLKARKGLSQIEIEDAATAGEAAWMWAAGAGLRKAGQ